MWNKELIVPAAELFRFEIRGLNPDTAYTIYFAIGNPAVNPNYPIVPRTGIGFRTLDANTIEYAGSDTFPILGEDTTGLRVSVVLGASWHTTLSYVVRLGDGAWNADPAGKHSTERPKEMRCRGRGGRTRRRKEVEGKYSCIRRQTATRGIASGGPNLERVQSKMVTRKTSMLVPSPTSLDPSPATHKLLSTQACLPRI